MRDTETTLKQLKEQIIEMCRRKGWGDDGIQNPQHVAMAMLVETMELLEHFSDMSRETESLLLEGKLPGECIEISEEMSDVLMYSMQIMYTLGVDVSKHLFADCSDAFTTVAELRALAGKADRTLPVQAMQVAVKARFVLELFQWLNDADIHRVLTYGDAALSAETGRAFAGMFREILKLANMLGTDICASIARKIAIVDKRVYPDDDPVR